MNDPVRMNDLVRMTIINPQEKILARDVKNNYFQVLEATGLSYDILDNHIEIYYRGCLKLKAWV